MTVNTAVSAAIHLVIEDDNDLEDDRIINPLTEFDWYVAAGSEDPANTPPADGGAIDTWRNAGSLGTAWAQATGAARMTYRGAAALFGGRPAGEGDGTDDKLEILTGVSLAPPWSAVFLGQLDTVASLQMLLGLHSGGTGRGLRVSAAGQIVYSNASGTVASLAGVITAGTPFLAALYVDGSTVTIVVNGAVVAGPTVLAGATIDQAIIGAGRSTGTTYGNHIDGQWVHAGALPGNIFVDPKAPGLLEWARERGAPS